MLWAGLTVPPAFADVTYTIMDYDQLAAWETDDHAAALTTFLNTCRDMKDVDWRNLCKFAEAEPEPRQFFELFFRPVLIEDGAEAMFTGYFEPELDGDLYPSSRYKYPIYSMPDEAKTNNPWLPRRDILDTDVMKGRGLEIAYVDDPVELFFPANPRVWPYSSARRAIYPCRIPWRKRASLSVHWCRTGAARCL